MNSAKWKDMVGSTEMEWTTLLLEYMENDWSLLNINWILLVHDVVAKKEDFGVQESRTSVTLKMR